MPTLWPALFIGIAFHCIARERCEAGRRCGRCIEQPPTCLLINLEHFRQSRVVLVDQLAKLGEGGFCGVGFLDGGIDRVSL